MANGISTAIRINDGMSPALKSMNKALMIVLNSFESMQSATADPINTAAISEARSELARVSTTLDDVENNARQASNAQEQFTNSVKQSDNAMSGLVKKVGTLVAAYASFQTLMGAVKLSDQMTQTDARLNMIVDDQGSVEVLKDKIMASANAARADYMATSDVISKLALRAGDAFKGANDKIDMDQVIGFTETLNKMYAISGASAEEQASSMLQLTQALGSGVLRGEEFNAVFEAAPNIMQEVAKYMDVPIGKLRELAADGQISAEIVKNAILSASGDIGGTFSEMDYTWEQVMNKAKNRAYDAFGAIHEKLNELANNEAVQNFIYNMVDSLAIVANLAVSAFEQLASMGQFIADNWSIISPIIFGVITALTIYAAISAIVATINGINALSESIKAAALMMSTGATFAATVAQHGLNAALLACPITWIVLGIIAIVAAVIAFCAWIAKSGGVATTAFGVIAGAANTAVAFIWNLFLGLVDFLLSIINYLQAPWVAFANFFGNLFNDPLAAIIHAFGTMADAVLGILEGIARAIDAVFGSNLADAVSGWRGSLDSKVEAFAKDKGNGTYKEIIENENYSTESLGLQRKDYGDAYKAGAAWGDGISNKVSDKLGDFSFDSILGKLTAPDTSSLGTGIDGLGGYDIPSYDELAGNVGDIKDNTGSIKDAVDVSEEDLKYLRDIAEQEAINRFTTAEISVDFGGVSNTINNDMDIDGFMDVFTDRLYESMTVAAEGLHS